MHNAIERATMPAIQNIHKKKAQKEKNGIIITQPIITNNLNPDS
jgi:hypothetical protein